MKTEAAAALERARAARAAGRWRECQDLAMRAAHLATAAGVASTAVPALLVSGDSAAARGAYGTALRTFKRALEVARASAPEWAAPAQHDVAVGLALTGHVGGASEMCGRALRLYSSDDPRRVRVQADRGAHLLDLNRPADAVAVLAPMVGTCPSNSHLGLLVRGNLAAALVSLRSDEGTAAVDEIAAAVEVHRDGPLAAWGWYALARGAAGVGDRERARQAAKNAARIATARGELAVLSSLQRLRVGL